MHEFWLGAILGWGVAIPIGPVNLEIIRRNLNYGMAIGMALGLGACAADMTYMLILCFGFLNLLAHPFLLKIIGIIGTVVLVYFAVQALKLKSTRSLSTVKPSGSALRNGLEGYAMTLINPFTILFWGSVSSQLSLAVDGASKGPLLVASLGVLFGVVTWVIFLNLTVKHTRHRLSEKVMQSLNISGGIILLCFAAFSLWRSLFVI